MNLRNTPEVKAWIAAYQGEFEWRKHKDCKRCGYPHAEGLFCGPGAVFGSFRIGRNTFAIDGSNVEYMYDFVKNQLPKDGFHWKDGIYFTKKSESVAVSFYTSYNNTPQLNIWNIPMAEWKTIVEQLK